MLKAITLSLCLGVCVSPAYAAAEKYTLDSAHTTVAFLIEHIGFAKTLGFFSDVTGSFNYDEETKQVTDISITVKTKSVRTDNKARDKHVRGKDFLSVKKHPKMVFTAAAATVAADNTVELVGKLELLGKSQPLTLAATINKAQKYPFGHKSFTLGLSARGLVKRSDFGMDYGVANGIVGDAIELIIETEANQK